MSDASAQPQMLSAEWIRQPENVELASAFAQFAAHFGAHMAGGPAGVDSLRQAPDAPVDEAALKHFTDAMAQYQKALTPQQWELVSGYMADHNTLQQWLDDQQAKQGEHTPREWGQRMTQPLPPAWVVGAYEKAAGRDPRGLPTVDPAKGQHETRIAWPGGSVERDAAPAPVIGGDDVQLATDAATATGGMNARAV